MAYHIIKDRSDAITELVLIRKLQFDRELLEYEKSLEKLSDEKLERIYNTIVKEKK